MLDLYRSIKAVTCLVKDRDALLTFYDFPAEHWDHLRTSNPIESVFATVRHRTVRTKGALSQDTARLMVFKLVTAAAKTWRRLKRSPTRQHRTPPDQRRHPNSGIAHHVAGLATTSPSRITQADCCALWNWQDTMKLIRWFRRF
jgi:hypothetical protein